MSAFEASGFLLLLDLISRDELLQLRAEVDRLLGESTHRGGARNVLDNVPPVAILEQVIALRLHLDDTPAENGALRVLPGTHKLGRLSNRKIASLRRETQEVVCEVPAGGAMLMSPLLLHASSASEAPLRRRVLHFEFSAVRLPGGLEWA